MGKLNNSVITGPRSNSDGSKKTKLKQLYSQRTLARFNIFLVKEKPSQVETPPYPIFRKVDSGGTIKKASPNNSNTLTARRKNQESNSKERTDRITLNAGPPGSGPKKPGYQKAKMASLKGPDMGTPERNLS